MRAEVPQLPAVRTKTTCRVLMISREAYRQVLPWSGCTILRTAMLLRTAVHTKTRVY